jgi:hypothetical protein
MRVHLPDLDVELVRQHLEDFLALIGGPGVRTLDDALKRRDLVVA